MIRRTGGCWTPPTPANGGTEWPLYFCAANVQTLEHAQDCLDSLLVAVNELRAPGDMDSFRGWIAGGKRVLVDSGVFNLAAAHAREHAMPLANAFALAPDQVDGFGALFERYVAICTEHGDKVWGYIEVDLGNAAVKTATRSRLEAAGLAPIPVYHPFADGWDYFDFLAQRYDRIALGNLVQADSAARKRLVATLWERRRAYPHLWIHALGLTASELVAAFPVNSCDSSTWISGVRWGSHNGQGAGKRLWDTGGGFTYTYDSEPGAPNGHIRARLLSGYDAVMLNRTMTAMYREAARVLGDPGAFLPPPS